MPISITVLVSCLLLILGAARAQISAPNCSDSSMNWSLNSLQQSPCLVGAYLQAVCNDSTFNIPALQPEQSYPGPTDGNICNCNTVVYSLMSACGQCQDGGRPSFPKPVPEGIRVPWWAYMPSFVGDSWDSTAAEIAGDSPEVTGSVVMASASQFPYSPTSLTSSSSSTFSPTASRSGSSSTFSHTPSGSGSSSTSTSHSSNRSKMEGSVIGGIVGATLIFGIVIWFVRRRRARSAPPTTDTRGKMEQPVAYQPLTIRTPKPHVWDESCNLYARVYFQDPSDPTTYPTTEFQPQRFGSTGHLMPSQVEYSGLPEL
ncbi:hypothetical protein V8E53_002643 [Lactarius tabidus]